MHTNLALVVLCFLVSAVIARVPYSYDQYREERKPTRYDQENGAELSQSTSDMRETQEQCTCPCQCNDEVMEAPSQDMQEVPHYANRGDQHNDSIEIVSLSYKHS